MYQAKKCKREITNASLRSFLHKNSNLQKWRKVSLLKCFAHMYNIIFATEVLTL